MAKAKMLYDETSQVNGESRCSQCGTPLPGSGGVAMQSQCLGPSCIAARLTAQADAIKGKNIPKGGGPTIDTAPGAIKGNNQSDDDDDDDADDDASPFGGGKKKAAEASKTMGAQYSVQMRPSSKDTMGG